jgi:ribosome-interacting GTPase 1
VVGLPEKIKQIEEEMSKTQINKHTEHHIGLLKAKLARLRAELEASTSKGGGPAFEIRKGGDATVVLIGLPSVGKSTILNRLTNAKSKVAAYAFTTLTVVPGILRYNGADIQILDLPGIISGASSGKGRGKRVLSVARNADLVLLVLDVFQPGQIQLLKQELHGMGCDNYPGQQGRLGPYYQHQAYQTLASNHQRNSRSLWSKQWQHSHKGRHQR